MAAELAKDGLGLDSAELAAIGHRVVHGGKHFTEPTVIDDAVLAEIERLIPVAPLHNPANLTGIRTAQSLRPDLPQVAVFDTAFHTTMPEPPPATRSTSDRRRAPHPPLRLPRHLARVRLPRPPGCWARRPRTST
ncbi:acetate kinase [Streptomyces tendae]